MLKRPRSRMDGAHVFLKLLSACAFMTTLSFAEVADGCAGIACQNNGTASNQGNLCHCVCPPAFSGLRCEHVLASSMWPPGPYAIPMPTSICPESSSHGWSEGYIHMAFASKLMAFQPEDACFWGLPLTSGHEVDVRFDDVISGPISSTSMRLNFCYKSGQHGLHGDVTWPRGNYSIYGTEQGCPAGFAMKEVTTCFPELLHWNADGDVPYFDVIEDANASVTHLVMRLCERTLPDDQMGEDTNLLGQSATQSFLLIQNENGDCPVLEGYGTTVQAYNYPVYVSTDGGYAPFTYCYFEPYAVDFNTDGCERIMMHTVSYHLPVDCTEKERASDTTGSCDNIRFWLLMDVGQTAEIAGIQFFAKLGAMAASIGGYTFDNWDLVPQFLLDMIMPTFRYIDGDLIEAFQFHIAIGNDPSQLVGDKDGVQTCDYTKDLYQHKHTSTGVNYKCRRKLAGRYVNISSTFTSELYTLMTSQMFLDQIIELSAIVCRKPADSGCYETIAMGTDVYDFQLTASSMMNGLTPAMVNPASITPWCALADDPQPFVQVDLISIMSVDGVILYNKMVPLENPTGDTIYEVINILWGTMAIDVTYATSLDYFIRYPTQKFYIDRSRRIEDPNYFIFKRSVLAKYVRIYPSRHHAVGRSIACLRFELLACAVPSLHSIDCVGNPTRHLYNTTQAYVSAETGQSEVFENTTLENCQRACADELQTCIGSEHSSTANGSTCTVYYDNPTKNYQLLIQDGYTDVLATINCWNEFEETTHADVVFSDMHFIASFGYPYAYACGETYTWTISLTSQGYIRLRFTEIALNNQVSLFDTCEDTIEFDQANLPTINQGLNGQKPNIVTMVSTLGMTFRACAQYQTAHTVNRFRAYAIRQDTPWCSGDMKMSARCSMPSASVSSPSYLDIPSIKEITLRWTIEPWVDDIIAIVIRFESFDISCEYGENDLNIGFDQNRRGELMDGSGAQYLCNGNRPYSDLVLLTPYVVVNFIGVYVDASESQSVFIDEFSLSYHVLTRAQTAFHDVTVTQSTIDDGTEHVISVACSEMTNKCYTFYYDRSESWMDAASYCLAKGEQLVTISTAEELELIKVVFLDGRAHAINTQQLTIHIGLTRHLYSKSDVWIDGRPATFLAWESGQPKDEDTNMCTQMNVLTLNSTRAWRTLPCDMSFPADRNNNSFICERQEEHNSYQFPLGRRANDENTTLEHVAKKLETLFHCGSGEWLSIMSVCNGLQECVDNSDELNCRSDECSDSEFRCGDGSCLHLSRVCDFMMDCKDSSDEYCDYAPCDEQTEHQCDNKQCIPLHQRCDGQVQCIDKSDETLCLSCNPAVAHQCDRLVCIPLIYMCDGSRDCLDGTDEDSCESYYFRTCDDVLKAGYTADGIYRMNSGEYMGCEFSQTDDGYWNITMTYYSIDWRVLYTNVWYWLTSAFFITLGAEQGYQCSQEVNITFRHGVTEVALLDNQIINLQTTEARFLHTFDESYEAMGKGFYLQLGRYLNILTSPKAFTSFEIQQSYDKDRHRIPLSPVICHKAAFTPNSIDPDSPEPEYDVQACGVNMPSTSGKLRCILDIDANGIVNGCRHLTHLQGCEDFECGENYVKCPESFCIPTAFICNGRADCPKAQDEIGCWCNQNDSVSTHVVIAMYSPDPPTENAFRLASRFVGHATSVYVITILDFLGEYVTANIHHIRFPTSHILTTPNISSFNFSMSQIVGDEPAETLAFISLSPEINHFPLESRIFAKLQGNDMNLDTSSTNNSSSVVTYQATFLYRLVIGEQSDFPLETSREFVPAAPQPDVTVPEDIIEIRVSKSEGLTTYVEKLFPEICPGPAVAFCEDGYVCSLSTVCLPISQVCDGHSDCPHGDDEQICGFDCPERCSCDGLTIVCDTVAVNWTHIEQFPDQTRSIDVSNNPGGFEDTEMYIGKMLHYLVVLKASHNGIAMLSSTSLHNTPNLITLDISHNNIRELPADMFIYTRHLTNLYVEGNHRLKVIQPNAFRGLTVRELSLKHCGIVTLGQRLFSGLNLLQLDLSYNAITTIADYAFADLITEIIDLTSNPIKTFSKGIFKDVFALQALRTPAYKYCCVRPAYLDESACIPFKDEFSSCADLMRNSVLQALLWVIGLFAVLGNIMSLVFRLVYDRARLKLGFGIFVTNLAVADLLMGIYLLIIATADTVFRNRYIEMEEYWRSSWWCQFSGVLSTVSSECSVLFLCLITVDRILVIKYPFGQVRFSPKLAVRAASACWALVLFLAFLPIFYTGYFENKFYTSRGVCVALPLTRDRPPGWLYSIVVFIVFNFMAFALIAFGQWMIYKELLRASKMKKKMNVNRSNDLKVARNLFLVVSTDFLCWFPIGCMGLIALSGYPIPGDVYAWTVVLILPINSALNPLLYTFSVLIGRQNMNPNVDEQDRTDMSTEVSNAVLRLFPKYSSVKKRLYKSVRLEKWLSTGTLTLQQVFYISLKLIHYLELLHDVDLVVTEITESNVLVMVDEYGNMCAKGVQIARKPMPNNRKKAKKDDILQVGNLIRRILGNTNGKEDSKADSKANPKQ